MSFLEKMKQYFNPEITYSIEIQNGKGTFITYSNGKSVGQTTFLIFNEEYMEKEIKKFQQIQVDNYKIKEHSNI